MWQAKFKNSIKSYLKTNDDLVALKATAHELDEFGAYGPDEELDEDLTQAINALVGKERLLRGVVRGNASMLLILCRPNEAALKGRQYAEAVHDLEVEYGMPGKKFRHQVEYRGQADKTLLEDNRDSRK